MGDYEIPDPTLPSRLLLCIFPCTSRRTHGLRGPLGPTVPDVSLDERQINTPLSWDGKARAPEVACCWQVAMLGGEGPTPLPHTCRHKQAHVKNQPGSPNCTQGGHLPPWKQTGTTRRRARASTAAGLGSSGSRLSIPESPG